MRANIFYLVLFLISAGLPVTSASAAVPKGAVKLTGKSLSKKNGYYCGKTGGTEWVPGRILSGNYFYSHTAEIANVRLELKKAKGAKKSQLQRSLTKLLKDRTSREAPCSLLNPKRLRFNFKGAKGLALASSSRMRETFLYSRPRVQGQRAARSNLRKVLSSGRMEESLATGTATIQKFLVGPNNTLYVLFSERTCIENPNEGCSNPCLLGEVNTTNGVVTCVDSQLDNIFWGYDSDKGIPSLKPLQFDNAGNLYYVGTSQNITVLRRYSRETKGVEDLINQNIELTGFLVLGDGSVLVSGRTASSNSRWFRKRRLDGSLKNIRPSSGPTWMAVFPDGRVYSNDYSYSGSSSVINRMNQSAEADQSIGWMKNSYSSLPAYVNSNHASMIDSVQMLHTTPSGEVYSLLGYSPNLNIFALYPQPRLISTSVTKVTGMKPLLSNLLIFGADDEGTGKLILYNTTDQSEVDLLGGRNIEVYRVDVTGGGNTIQFDGLRFSDGKYVLCSVNVGPNTIACSPTGSSKLADFQSLSQPGVGLPVPVVEPPPVVKLVKYDFSGASAVTSGHKITSSGEVMPIQPLAVGREKMTILRKDELGNFWQLGELSGVFLTDADTEACKLATINTATGLPTCVFSGATNMVDAISTAPNGRTYFLTTDDGSAKTLRSVFNGASSVIASLGVQSGFSASMLRATSDGNVLVDPGLRLVKPDGTITEHISHYWTSALGEFPDGRLVYGGTPGIRTLTSSGSSVNPTPWANSSYGAGEVGCNFATDSRCYGYPIFGFLPVVNGKTFGFVDGILSQFYPGPVDESPLSTRFTSVVGSVGDNVVYVGGRTDVGTNKIFALNTATNAVTDLTDQPTFEPRGLLYRNNRLYISAAKDGCHLGIKEVGGGTLLTKVSESSCASEIFAFN